MCRIDHAGKAWRSKQRGFSPQRRRQSSPRWEQKVSWRAGKGQFTIEELKKRGTVEAKPGGVVSSRSKRRKQTVRSRTSPDEHNEPHTINNPRSQALQTARVNARSELRSGDI